METITAANPKTTMKTLSVFFFWALALLSSGTHASVFMPSSKVKGGRYFAEYCSSSSAALTMKSQADARRQLRSLSRKFRSSGGETAMAIPGYGLAEQVFVGGFANFLSIYNIVITARILLSWFPQAQGIGLLQPVYAITDPYLNLFRGIIPPIFGLDLSPILAFLLLSFLGNATAAVGAQIPSSTFTKPTRKSRQQQQQQSVKTLLSTRIAPARILSQL